MSEPENLTWIERSYEKCSGCRRCEIACSLFHEGRIWPEASRVRIFMLVPGIEIPHLCFQCEDYLCVEACAFNALSINSKTGAVNVDISKCTACGSCIRACPARIPHMHPSGKYVVICDLCNGSPKCVETCMEGKWNALRITPKKRGFSYKSLAKTPEELTREVVEDLYGENIAREVHEW